MIRWTTPTFTIRLKDAGEVDLTEAENVYFTVSNKTVTITKTGDDLEVGAQTVEAFLSQEESAQLQEGTAEIQVNWTYPLDENGYIRRAATKPRSIRIDKNLLREVIV